MREISTKSYEVGEHVIIDGEEYVVAHDNGDGTCNGCSFKNADCHNIICGNFIFKKLEPEPRLMTNRELAKWLAKGNGQLKNMSMVYSYNSYLVDSDNEPVKEHMMIRPWGDTRWIKPTYDIYERDCS